MDRTPLGELCLRMGLLRTGDVDTVLRELQARGHGRFGEIAVELGLLTDSDVAQALARQYQLVYVDEERVARLTVPADVLALLPPHLLRERLLVPTFLDPELRVVSLLTADPTDLPTLRAAQEGTRAAQLRLFVATPRALLGLLDRVLPGTAGAWTGPQARAPRALRVGVVVLEPDLRRLSALRRLAVAEGATAELAADPEQVTATLEAGLADRVLMRRAVEEQARPYLGAWRRARPGLRTAAVDGFGPSERPVVDHRAFRAHLLGLLDLVVGSMGAPPAGRRPGGVHGLVRALGAHAGLPVEHRDALELAAILRELDRQPAWARAAGGHALGAAAAAFAAAGDPLEVGALLEAVARRAHQPAGGASPLAVELLHTAFAAVDAGVRSAADAEALVDGGHRRDAVDALAAVLRRRELCARIAAGGGPTRPLLAAGCDRATATWLEGALDDAGFALRCLEDLSHLAAEVAERPPLALLVDADLPAAEVAHALAALALDPSTAALPLLLLGEPRAELPEEAEVVHLPRPADPDAVLRLLRWEVSRAAPSGQRLESDLQDLGVRDLVEQLVAGRHTAELVVRTATDEGRLSLRRGDLRSARWRGQVGVQALAGLLGARGGSWSLCFQDPGDAADMAGEPADLLAEALRLSESRG